MSTPELARRLGLSLRTVQRYIAAGDLVPDLTTPGGQYRWDVDRVRQELRGRPPKGD